MQTAACSFRSRAFRARPAHGRQDAATATFVRYASTPTTSAVGSRKFTHAQLYEEIRKLDPSFVVNIDRNENRVTRMALLATGTRILEGTKFTTPAGARARVVLDGISSAMTPYASPGAIGTVKETWKLWVVAME